jgi:hypothetical protein
MYFAEFIKLTINTRHENEVHHIQSVFILCGKTARKRPLNYVQSFGMEKQTRLNFLDFKLYPCSECCMLSSG